MSVEAEDFVRRFTEAWERREPEGMAALFAPHGVAVQPPVDGQFGADQVAEYFRQVFSAMPDMRLAPLSWAARDGVVFIEWEAHATLGKERFTWRGVDRFRLEGGQAVDEEVYFDMLPLWERFDPTVKRDRLIHLEPVAT